MLDFRHIVANSSFLQALVVGVSIAAPVGPIGLLTIRRTLEQGAAAGLATGLGAATADAVYGALGAYGVQWAIAWLIGAKVPMAVGGCALLLWMAWGTARAPLAKTAVTADRDATLFRCFSGTFVLTLSNPATVLSFVAVFGALAGAQAQPSSPHTLVLGVWLGSLLWWAMLCGGISRWRHKLSDSHRLQINRLSAVMLAAFAFWQIWQIREQLWA